MKELKDPESARPLFEDFSHNLLDNLLEGCQIISPDWRYLYVNDAVLNQVKRPREQLVGRTMMAAYPGIENTPMFTNLRQCMEERIPCRMENEFAFPDGSKGWFDVRFEPVPEGVFIFSLDISERIRAEAEQKMMV
ncbi:MAG: PAS domain-containing protein [Desulfosalsimonadaceae bacterium]|nr:PAS domain-containing protein [Desulfosalsimonadaceae bacterium]